VLRITREGDAGSPSLKLEGRLEGPWVEVLRKAWEDSMVLLDGGKVTIDLGAISFADRNGRELLRELQKKGTTLARVSEFMRHILADRDETSD
jgi:hypothetical protein